MYTHGRNVVSYIIAEIGNDVYVKRMYLDIVAIQQNNLPGSIGRNTLFILNIAICNMAVLVLALD
jgi:hypothetical protein